MMCSSVNVKSEQPTKNQVWKFTLLYNVVEKSRVTFCDGFFGEIAHCGRNTELSTNSFLCQKKDQTRASLPSLFRSVTLVM